MIYKYKYQGIKFATTRPLFDYRIKYLRIYVLNANDQFEKILNIKKYYADMPEGHIRVYYKNNENIKIYLFDMSKIFLNLIGSEDIDINDFINKNLDMYKKDDLKISINID